MLTARQFQSLFPNCSKTTARQQLPLLNATMLQYGITTKLRIAAFCATLAQESGEFRYRNELASGRAYEGRRDLGNVKPGDGVAMKGHGRIQITGRKNHTAYARYIKKSGHVPYVDFSDQKLAKKICDDPYALDSAGWFWSVLNNLNKFADAGKFLRTQVRVNGRNKRTGKPNHWKERLAYYKRALRILPDDIGTETPIVAVVEAADAPAVDSVDSVAVDPQLTTEPEVTAQKDTAPADESDNGGELLSKAAANESAREAGKSLLKKLGLRVARPLVLLYSALEAGNVFAWLGVIVFVVGVVVLIYFERHALRRLLQQLVKRISVLVKGEKCLRLFDQS